MPGPYYWVGGSGNWSDAANHWATVSGGAPNAANVPGSADDVHFDAASNPTAYTVTLDGSPVCRDFMFDANPSVSGIPTLMGSAALLCYGSSKLIAGMASGFSGSITYKATSGIKTMTWAGVQVACALIFDGVGGTFQMADDYYQYSGGGPTLLNGTFDANGKTFTSATIGTMSLTGAFTFYNLTLTGNAITTAALSLTANITVAGTLTGTGNSATNRLLIQSSVLGTSRTITARAVALTNCDCMDITGAGTANWSVNEGSDVVVNGEFTSGTTGWTNYGGGATTTSTPAAEGIDTPEADGRAPPLSADILKIVSAAGLSGASQVINTVPGNTYRVRMVLYGVNAASQQLRIGSTQTGGEYFLNSAINTLAGVWEQIDVTFVAGASTAYLSVIPSSVAGRICYVDSLTVKRVAGGISLGDCLGNSGITFTPAATQYWKTTTTGIKYFSTAGNWFLATNGGGGAGRCPLPQDNVVFDAASIGAAGTQITIDYPRAFKDMTCTGVTNSPSITNTGGLTVACFGSLTLTAGITWAWSSFGLVMYARSAVTITSAGKSFYQGLQLYGPGITVTLQDALTTAYQSNLTLVNGTLNANNMSVTIGGRFTLNAGCTVNMGSGTWAMTGDLAGSGVLWNIVGGTLNSNTSTLKFTNPSTSAKVMYGGGKNYNNLWFSGGASSPFSLTGSNTFADFKADPGSIVQFTAGTTQTAATWHIDGAVATGADMPVLWSDGASGSSASTPNSAALQALVGDLDVDFAYGPALWAAGANSQIIGNYDGIGGVTGWRVLKVTANTFRLDVYVAGGLRLCASPSIAANTNGTIYRYRVLRIAATGNYTWMRSDDNGASWTTISGPTAGTAGNIAAPTTPLYIAAANVAGFEAAMKVAFARVYAGDRDAGGTLVAGFDAALYTGSGNTLVGGAGEVWTRNGNAQFTATNRTTLAGVTNSAYTLAKSGGGVVSLSNMSIRNAAASPANTFYAGATSFDGGGNTGWLWQNMAVLSGDAAAAAVASGALDAGIALAGVALSVAGAGGTLTTQIPLAAAAVAMSAAGGLLNAQITLSGAALAEAAAAAGLDTAIALDGLAGGSAAASGTLTVQIVLSGDAAAAAGAGGEMSAQVQLSAIAIAQALASGSLTTEIPLAGFAQASANVGDGFVTRPRIHGYRLESSHARITHLLSRDARIEQ